MYVTTIFLLYSQKRKKLNKPTYLKRCIYLIFSFNNILASCRIVKTKIGCWLYLKSGEQFWEAQAQSLSPLPMSPKGGENSESQRYEA